MSNASFNDPPSVSIVVRGDVAVLTFGMGSTEDKACASEVYAQAYGTAQCPGDCSAPDHWGPGNAYLLHEQLFVHSADVAGIVYRLEQRGHWVELDPLSDCPLHRDSEMLPQAFGLTNTENAILERVRQQSCGQIIVPPDWIPGIAAAVATLFSMMNVLIVAKNSDTVQGLTRKLRKLTNRELSSGVNVDWHAQPLVHVQALSGLDRACQDWQVLIFADVESARSETGMRVATSMPLSAIYTIRSAQQKLDWEDELRLRVTSGPEIYRLTEAPLTNTTVTVISILAKQRRKVVPRNPLKRKRLHNWNNEARNQQVAKLAEGFANLDQKQLAQSCLPVDKLTQQLAGLGERPRIAVIAENVEHGKALRRFLPGWRLATGMRPSDKNIPQLPMDEQRLIITLTRARAAGVVADVIIRADGTEQGWRWDYGPHYGLNRASMMIVDMCDSFDAAAYEAGRIRCLDYARRLWYVLEARSNAVIPAK